MTHNIAFVGIDVGKFEFCVFCGGTDLSFSLPNSVEGYSKLISHLGSPDGKIIALEPTGGCEWALWETLEREGFDVRQVCAVHVRNFARSLGNLAKTDPIDARMIARFIAFRPEVGRRLPAEILRKLNVCR
jgi:transposase